MPRFSYIVKDTSGKTYRNVMEGMDQTAIVDKLQKQGYFVVSVKELSIAQQIKKPQIKKSSKSFSHSKIKLNDLLTFSRQLAAMLESGVTLLRSLDVIQSQVQSEQLHRIIVLIRKDVEGGKSLSVALSKYPKVFNQFWVSLVEVGEASGTIPVVLNKLAFYLEQQAHFRSVIASGMIYPGILFAVSMGAVAFFALFVGPRFESIFNSMKVELPLITRLLLMSFAFIKARFFLIIGFIVGGFFLLRSFLSTYQGKLLFEKFMFSLPNFGDVYRLIIVERFAAQMAILIDAGVPILYALDITERLVDNNTCALIVNSVKEGVRNGELLIAPMERSGFFPPMAIQMIMVGEETGELSKMLKHVSAFYQNEVETFMKRFSTVIEPFMIVFMGIIIGTIVIAMFLPLFNIAQLGGAGR